MDFDWVSNKKIIEEQKGDEKTNISIALPRVNQENEDVSIISMYFMFFNFV